MNSWHTIWLFGTGLFFRCYFSVNFICPAFVSKMFEIVVVHKTLLVLTFLTCFLPGGLSEIFFLRQMRWRLFLFSPTPHPLLYPDSSVALPALNTALFPMDLRVGERGMRPCSDTALLTPLHPPLLLTPFSPQPRTSFSQQQLHQHIRVPDFSWQLHETYTIKRVLFL